MLRMTVLSDKSSQLLYIAFKFILPTTGSITQGFYCCIPNTVFLYALLFLISLHTLYFLVCTNISWYLFHTFWAFLLSLSLTSFPFFVPLNSFYFSNTISKAAVLLFAVSFLLSAASHPPSLPNHLIAAVLWCVRLPVQSQFNYVFQKTDLCGPNLFKTFSSLIQGLILLLPVLS